MSGFLDREFAFMMTVGSSLSSSCQQRAEDLELTDEGTDEIWI